MLFRSFMVALLCASGGVLAGPPPCEPAWTPGFIRDGCDRAIESMVVFDLDGAGPQPARVVIASSAPMGGIPSSSGLFTWDGTRYAELPGLSVTTLRVLDPDGAGPGPAEMFAIRSASPSVGIYRWSNGAWTLYAPPPNTSSPGMTDLIFHDFDGPGPEAPQLTIISNSRVYRRSGTTWTALGGGITAARRLASADLDGVGPGLPTLTLSTNNSIYRWTGTTWTQTLSGTIVDIAPFDLDGSGPGNTEIIAVGAQLSVGVLASAARLGPAGWQVMSIPPAQQPRNGRLSVIGGALAFVSTDTFTGGLRIWNGFAWDLLSQPPGDTSSREFGSLALFDPDGPGGEPASVLVAGDFRSGSAGFRSIARVTRAGWMPLARIGSLPNSIAGIRSFDADGDGPQPPRLYGIGTFPAATGGTAIGVARWESDRWLLIAPVTETASFDGNGLIHSLQVFDPDGPGPEREKLYVVGWFDQILDLSSVGIAAFDGTAWTPVNDSPLVNLDSVSIVDLDGDGPQNAQILITGIASTGTIRKVGAFNGATWSLLPGTPPEDLLALAAVQPQPGQPPELVALHRLGGLSRFNGAGWAVVSSAFFSGSAGYLQSARMFDDDGSGPNPPRLYVGGPFDSAGGISVPSGLVRYDGATWTPIALQDYTRVDSMTVADLDGPGPNPPRLVLAGSFLAQSAPFTSDCLAVFDGLNAQFFGNTMLTGPASSIAALLEPDAQTPTFFLSGLFYAMGASASNLAGIPSAGFARFGCDPCISFTSQPFGGVLAAGHAISISAQERLTDRTPPLPLTFQWQKDGVNITDGSGIIGSTTRTLRIDPLHPADSGVYTLQVTADCGSASSAPATITVRCLADRDGNSIVDVGDLLGFITEFFYTPGFAADFNGDLTISVQDLLDYVQAYFTGC